MLILSKEQFLLIQYVNKMWTEGIEKETEAGSFSFQERIDALRSFQQREGGLAMALGNTERFDCTSVNEVLRGKLYIGCEIAASKINTSQGRG